MIKNVLERAGNWVPGAVPPEVMKYCILIIIGLFFLPALPGAPAPCRAAAATPERTLEQPARVSASSPLLAESWFSKFYRGLVSSLRSRKAMFQFALVGMLICLWIIWWRK